jgi:PAS domain S-box-containing protein
MSIAHQLFQDSPVLRVGNVTLGAADDLPSHRAKLARVMLDELFQFVALLDVEGNVIEVNRTALEGAGLELDEIQGMPFWDVRCWPASDETRRLRQDCARRARFGEFVRHDFEIYAKARGTQTILIDFSLAPIRDTRGQIVLLLAEGRNISARKLVEAQVAKKNDVLRGLLAELRGLDHLKTAFFADVNHEFQTPLALILNLAAGLAQGANLTARQQLDLSALERNAGTMHRHVSDLLDTAKIDSAAKAAVEELPLMEEDRRETVDQPTSPARPLVLLAEHHIETRRFIMDILRTDYRVVAVADAEVALLTALAEPPDLVVTDLAMPKLAGERLIFELRAQDTLAHVPILVLSAIADEDLRLKLLAQTVQDYIVKPFSAQEVRVRVRNLVAMKRTRDALQKELVSQNEDLSQLADQLVYSQQALRHSLDKLALSEERWHAVFENSPAGIALTDAAGRIHAANAAYQKMLGFSLEELSRLSLLDLTYEDDRQASRELLSDLLQRGNGGARQTQGRYRCKDGTVIWGNFSLSLIPRRGRGPEYAIVISEDITRRKRVERLHEYEQIVEALQEMIVVVDRDYRYLIANRAYLTFRGAQKEQIIGKLVADSLKPGVLENSLKEKMDDCFRGNVVKFEMRHAYPGRSERDLSISYFPVEGPTGVDRIACIFQDVTERKETDEAFRTLSGRLLRLEDDERRRLARELHDSTAQLLAALSMNLSVVNQSAAALNPRAQAAMAESVALADRCLREVRTVSYLLHPRELDDLGLESALSSYIDGFSQRSGIQVAVEVSPNLSRLPPAVETTVFRIVQECLTNIHRHSGSATAQLRLTREPSNLVLEVADAGHGIRPGAPSGIGIAGMRERAQQLHGSLEIASHPTGTTVKAIIPLATPPL